MLPKLILTLLAFVCLGTLKVEATHTMGANLTYECVGTNEYQVKLTLFRDCAGILPVDPQKLEYQSASCGVSASINLYQLGTALDVTPICPTEVSRCQPSPTTNFGIEEYTYTGTLTLPSGCSDWVLSWGNCCRNFAITSLNAPGHLHFRHIRQYTNPLQQFPGF